MPKAILSKWGRCEERVSPPVSVLLLLCAKKQKDVCFPFHTCMEALLFTFQIYYCYFITITSGNYLITHKIAHSLGQRRQRCSANADGRVYGKISTRSYQTHFFRRFLTAFFWRKSTVKFVSGGVLICVCLVSGVLCGIMLGPHPD